MNRWCVGLPMARQRPLDEAERAALTAERRRYRRTAWGVIVGFLFVLAVVIVAITGFGGDTGDGVQTTLAIAAIGTTLSLPITILLARDNFGRAKSARADLQADLVEIYEGAVSSSDTAATILSPLYPGGILPESPIWIEALAGSGRLWRAKGYVPRRGRWMILPRADIAETPPVATTAAEWLEPVSEPDADGTRMMGGSRELSPEESQEILKFARRHWKRPLPAAIGLTLWWAVPVTILLLGERIGSTGAWVQFAFLTIAAGMADFNLVKAIRLASALRADAGYGRVIILRAESAPVQAGEIPSADLAPYEVLPHSGIAWTQNGQPAEWRRSPVG